MSNLLSGLSSLAYQGTNASNPPNLIYATQNPTQYDGTNVSLGDLWLNRTNQTVWLLVALNASLATWAQLGVTASEVDTLTGNSGGAVGPDGSNNINVVGDGTTITISGNPGTSTLTASVIPGSLIVTVTGNSGGTVSPDGSGNFNIVGDGTTIDIVGNPGTNTLTASVLNAIDITLTGNTGGPVSATGGNFDIVGDGTTIEITGDPMTHTLTASIAPGIIVESLTGNTGGPIFPDSDGNIDILGTAGIIEVTGNPMTNTLTIDAGSELATSYATDSGSAIPASSILTIAGGTNINTSGAGNTVTINLDSTLTGITNLTVDNLTVNTSATLGFTTAGVVQTNSSGVVSSTKGTNGQVLISSTAGAPAWATITAGANVTVTNGANSITIAASGGGSGSGLVLLASRDMTGQSIAAFTSTLSSSYYSYMLVADQVVLGPLGGASYMSIQYSENNGVTYPSMSGIANYHSGANYSVYNSSVLNNFSVGGTGQYGILAYFLASASNQTISFTHYSYDLFHASAMKLFAGQYTLYNPTNVYMGQSCGAYERGLMTNITINALRVVTPAVCISGTIELYGLTF